MVKRTDDLRNNSAALEARAKEKKQRDTYLRAHAALHNKPIEPKKVVKKMKPNHGFADPNRRKNALNAFYLARLENDLRILDTNPSYNPDRSDEKK